MRITLSELRQMVRDELRNSRSTKSRSRSTKINLMEAKDPHSPTVEEVVQRYKDNGMWSRVRNEFQNAADGDLSEIGDYYPGWKAKDFQAVVDEFE